MHSSVAITDEQTQTPVALLTCPAPWRENLYGLISLWEMLTCDAGRLVRAMQFLAESSRLLAGPGFSDGLFSHLTGPDFYTNSIRGIIEYCDEMSFPMTKIPLERILRMTSDPHFTVEMMVEMLGDATRRLRDEADVYTILKVSPERSRFYNEPRAGWEEVARRFPRDCRFYPRSA